MVRSLIWNNIITKQTSNLYLFDVSQQPSPLIFVLTLLLDRLGKTLLLLFLLGLLGILLSVVGLARKELQFRHSAVLFFHGVQTVHRLHFLQ